MTSADDFVQAVLRADLARTRFLLQDLDDPARRAMLADLKKASTELRRTGRLWSHPRSYDTLGLALLGCTTGAAAVSTHLGRWWKWGPTRGIPIVDVLVDRNPRWLPDLVDRLAAQDTTTDIWNSRWGVLEELRRRLGLPRPQTPYYVRGLIGELSPASHRKVGDPEQPPLLTQLRADDEIIALLPLVLDVADLPGLMAETVSVSDPATRKWESVQLAPEATWRGAIVALCAEGRLDRGATADACLRVLLRGEAGRASFHLALLIDLDLDLDEVAARQRSFVQLLGEGTGASVKHAQRALRSLDEADRLGIHTLVEASALVLARPDKGLASTQLGWLDKAARRPGAVDDALLAVADAFGHERSDVQERAVAIAAKHLDRARPETRDRLAAAAAVLAPSVRVTAAPVLGVADAPAVPEPARVIPAPRPAGGWPVRGHDLGDLAETTAALIEHLDDAVLLESVLAGLARLRNVDRAAFDAAMDPVRHRLRQAGPESESWGGEGLDLEISSPQAKLLRLLLLDPPRAATGSRWRGVLSRARHVHRYALPEPQPSPTGIVTARMRELTVRLMEGAVAELIAVPTEESGLLDPAALAHRLARLEGAGAEPWPADLQQALLRLPRTPDAGALAAAERLSSPAGRALAEQLRHGHVDPESRLRVDTVRPRNRWMWPAHPTNPVALVGLHGHPLDPAHLATLALDLPDPFILAGRTTRAAVALGCGLWSAALPAHPEVLAAHALIALCDLPESPGHPATRRLVATLPDLDGPVGPAVAVAVLYALGARDGMDRTAGSDAVVGLARRQVDGEPVGRVLAGLVADTGLKAGRVATALDDAARAGRDVAAFVWQAVSTALPPLLRSGTRDVHRLVATAADAAAVAGARGEVTGLAEVAGRGGGSRVVVEARRLLQVLGR